MIFPALGLVHPAALPLDLIVDLALAVVLAVMLAVAPGLGAGRLAPAGRVTPVLASTGLEREQLGVPGHALRRGITPGHGAAVLLHCC